MSEKDWAAMIDVMESTNLIKSRLPLEQYYTNAYAPD
jgi:hypothetical protein